MYGKDHITNVSAGRDLGLMDVETKCPFCGEITTVEVYQADFGKWANGVGMTMALNCVTNADDPFDSAERLISGVCRKCWANETIEDIRL